MDDRGANIDLLFRNGLKDYEVLPPNEAWDNIRPVIRKKPYLVYLRVAAAVAVLFSLSFIAWMLNRDVPDVGISTSGAFNIPGSRPVRLAESVQEYVSVNSSGFTPAGPLTPVFDEITPGIIIPDEPSTVGEFRNTSGDFAVPQKADGSLPPQNINIENIGKNLPEAYPDMKPPERKWSVSAMASPTYFSFSGSGNREILDMARSENSATSYTGGVGFSYKISKRFSIQTGFYYSAYGREIGGVSSFAGFNEYSAAKGESNFEVITSNGPVRTRNGDVFLIADNQPGKVRSDYNDNFDPAKANLGYVNNSIIQKFSYIQMPLLLRYKVVDRNIDLNLLGGVSYDFLVGNSAFTRTDGEKYPIGDTEGMNTMLFSSSLGMGVEYNFSGKISLNFEPTFRYFLNPFNDAAGTKIHPYSFGVFSGFSYRF